MIVGAALAVLAATPGVAVSLDGRCPDRPSLARALAALGVKVLPEGSRAAVRADVSEDPGVLALVLTDGRRRDARTIAAAGTCDERAATLAAIIERFARPVLLEPVRPSTADAGFDAGAEEPVEPDAGVPEPEDAGPPPIVDAGLSAPPASTLAGGVTLRAAGALTPGFRGAVELAGHIGVAGTRGELAVGWATPLSAPYLEGVVSTQEVRLALRAAHVFSAFPVRIEGGVLTTLLWASARGYPRTDTAFRLNPAATLGLGLSPRVGLLELEALLRGMVFFDERALQIDGVTVITTPRWEAHLSLGVGLLF